MNSKNLTATIAYTGRQDLYPVANALRFLPLFFWHLLPHFTFKNVFFNRKILFGVDVNKNVKYSIRCVWLFLCEITLTNLLD